MTKTYTPHVHAETIKAWADGKTIQFKAKSSDEWDDANCNSASKHLMFYTDYFYRVKPEEEVDYALVYENGVVAAQFYPSTNDVYMFTGVSHYVSRQGFVKRTLIDGKVISFEFISK